MGALGAGGGVSGQYQSTATATSGTKQSGLFSNTFGDFNVGSGTGSGLKFNATTLGIGAAVLIAFFYFRRGR